jgi:hypothetical protein
LTATATFSDHTMRDVTAETKWSSTDPRIVTVSTKGLVTVVRLGVVNVDAYYQDRHTYVIVKATPPGTFGVTGWVHEPGQGHGGVLADVRVLDTRSGVTTTTDHNGQFGLVGLTGALRFEKEAYETTERDPTPNEMDVRMQRIIRLTAGDTVTPARLAPNDTEFTLGTGDRCFPCRLIRITVPAAGTLHIDVQWSEPKAVLALWANSRQFLRTDQATELAADVPVSPGELIVYLQQLPQISYYFVPFTVATSLSTASD